MSRSPRKSPFAPSLICAAAMLAACSPPDGTSGEGTDAPAARDAAAAGEALFEENCGVCHGAGGRGPALATLKALSPEDLRAAIRNHPTAGQIPNRLPANEISDLIEFLED